MAVGIFFIACLCEISAPRVGSGCAACLGLTFNGSFWLDGLSLHQVCYWEDHGGGAGLGGWRYPRGSHLWRLCHASLHHADWHRWPRCVPLPAPLSAEGRLRLPHNLRVWDCQDHQGGDVLSAPVVIQGGISAPGKLLTLQNILGSASLPSSEPHFFFCLRESRASKMIKGLEQPSCEEVLRGMGLSSLGKRQLRRLHQCV